MEADHAAEELLTSRKHLENARSFMLALLLLVVIAAIHLIWTCVSMSTASQALADRQQGSAFLRDEELALRGYLAELSYCCGWYIPLMITLLTRR